MTTRSLSNIGAGEQSGSCRGAVLVLGATGMLGHTLAQRLARTRAVVATTRGTTFDENLKRRLANARLLSNVEAENLASVERVIEEVRPVAVVNCIGIIKQLKEAKDPIPSIEVNALFPHRLGRLTSARGIRLVHFSTDCVFSGQRGNYTEDDVADANDLYGRTKYLGEVAAEGCLTLRSSIIGHELRGHVSLLDWFLAQRGKRVSGFARALYSGLTTVEMAALVERVLNEWSDLQGLWQVSSEPISKYELLCLVNSTYGLGVTIDRDEKFFCDRRLDSTRFRKRTAWQPPSWPQMIGELHSNYMTEIK